MINANKEKLLSFFQNNLQFEIPFFQRSYVWEQDNWETFWDHLLIEVEEYKKGKNSEHFIGTIITKEKEAQRLGQNLVELIDGQQRLTTVALLLKAIELTCTGEFANLKDNIKSYLQFKDSQGSVFIRIKHSKIDTQYFANIIRAEKFEDIFPKNAEKENATPQPISKIVEAYKYFHRNLEKYTDSERDTLLNVLLQKVPVISMLLSKDDDEQEIFDTINSLGVKLSTGELLKNYIFKDELLQPHFKTHWEDVFEVDEQSIAFWAEEKTAGRVTRDNIELLLYSYLIIETGKEVTISSLFKEYKNWLKPKTTDEKKAFLEILKEYATVYSNFPDATELNEIAYNEDKKRLFHVIENLEITTVLPLLMFIYKTVEKEADQIQFLKILESYLVRRNVCRLTTKNYNNLFLQILREIQQHGSISPNNFQSILAGFEEETNRFPSDAEFEAAFLKEIPYNKNAREILYCIALKDLDNGYTDTKKLSVGSLSVEHMMPKKWETNWPRLEFNEHQKAVRGRMLQTYGNLTLVTKRLNSRLQNARWEDKRATLLNYSKMEITTAFISKEDWDETEIEVRGKKIAEKALKIWPYNIK